MSVTRAPTGEEGFSDIGPIISVRVLQEDKFRGHLYDQSVPRKTHTGRDRQFVCEEGRFVGLAVPVRIFKDSDPVLS